MVLWSFLRLGLVAKAGFELLFFLTPPQCWDSRCLPLCPVFPWSFDSEVIRGTRYMPPTRRPRGFSTLGFWEKCMCKVPSSLTVTDTFFRVLFPQCPQNTRFMSDVVLGEHKRKGTHWHHRQETPPPASEKERTRNAVKAKFWYTHLPKNKGC